MRLTGGASLPCLAFLVIAAPFSSFGQSALPVEVSAVQQGHGWQFTDAHGMTLYHYELDQQEPGKSACIEECATKRPPLTTNSDRTKTFEKWSLITRDDGSEQWVFDGNPVYTYLRDAYAGATFGNGEGWSIAFQAIAMPSGITTAKTVLGHVLASSKGMTMYSRDVSAVPTPSGCVAECLETWLPMRAPWVASGVGDFSVVTRDDGFYQWAYRTKPLYLYAKDSKLGDTNGDGIDGVWAAVVLEPALPYPSWVTVVGSDGGELLADSKGMTLYAYDVDRNSILYPRGEDCFAGCITESWSPVRAPARTPPIGNWSVTTNDDQFLQWTYMGKPLYTSKLETAPGDLSGITMRRHRAWRPIMRSIPSLQGASPNG